MDFHPALLGTFIVVIILMLLLDLGIFNKKEHVVSTKEASIWTVVWIALSMLFSIFVYYDMGSESFYQYQSAYWIEKSLSIDNLFVFVLIFAQFKIPKIAQHKVLFYGILGALFFRAFFIFAGVELIAHTYLSPMNVFGFENVKFNVVLTIFGFFLLYAGVNSAIKKDDDNENFKDSIGARVVKRFFKVSNEFDGTKFFTVKNGIKYATPLFMALVIIEFSDLIFAVDSIPAIFSVSKDPIILYTSNIFAILGLRSLYFILASVIDKFRHLKYALAGILVFIGIKMIIEPFFEVHSVHSLIIIGTFLVVSILTSIIIPSKVDESIEK